MLPPFSFWARPEPQGLRIFQSSGPMTGPDLPLLSLDASFASFPSLAAITVLSGSQRLVIAPGFLLFWPFSICRKMNALFTTPCEAASEKRTTSLRSPTPSGFGYPLDVFLRPSFLESLFQLSTLLGFSLQSFLPHQGSKIRFRTPSPLLRFLSKPLGLEPALQRLALPNLAVFLLAPWNFHPGRNPLLS